MYAAVENSGLWCHELSWYTLNDVGGMTWVKQIVIGVLLIVTANVFWYMPEGPTLFSLPFTLVGVALILYGLSVRMGTERKKRPSSSTPST